MKLLFASCLMLSSTLYVLPAQVRHHGFHVPPQKFLSTNDKNFATKWYEGLVFLNNGDTIPNQIGFSINGMLVKEGIYEKPFSYVYPEDQVVGYRIYRDQDTSSVDYVKVKSRSGFFKVLVSGKVDVVRQDKLIGIKNKLNPGEDFRVIKGKKELIKTINQICNKNFKTSDFDSVEDALETLVNYLK